MWSTPNKSAVPNADTCVIFHRATYSALEKPCNQSVVGCYRVHLTLNEPKRCHNAAFFREALPFSQPLLSPTYGLTAVQSVVSFVDNGTEKSRQDREIARRTSRKSREHRRWEAVECLVVEHDTSFPRKPMASYTEGQKVSNHPLPTSRGIRVHSLASRPGVCPLSIEKLGIKTKQTSTDAGTRSIFLSSPY